MATKTPEDNLIFVWASCLCGFKVLNIFSEPLPYNWVMKG